MNIANTNRHLINEVVKGSKADNAGIKKGDYLLSINDEEVTDIFDYRFLILQDKLSVLLERNGESYSVEIDNSDEEDLGFLFDNGLMDEYRRCKNNCIFCFIDQMPPNLRKTLYVKDDDWRLSLMMGNFVTLTNIGDQEMKRIIRRHASPLYISVHTTDPALRIRMMGTPAAGRIMDQLRLLRANDISYHCQIVLCHGINDGDALKKTLDDLAALRPAALSVALVPVGLTRFRDHLTPIEPYSARTAGELLDMIEPIQKRFLEETGSRFVFPSDEFYCLSGRPLPEEDTYEGFPQIENGVGMLRAFESEIADCFTELDRPSYVPQRLVIACGTSAAPFIQALADRYAPAGTVVTVRPIVNRFFGETVTVTGLITGRDLTDQLRDADCDRILICRNMLREDGDLFLDGSSIHEVRSLLKPEVRVVPNTGEGFLRALYGLEA